MVQQVRDQAIIISAISVPEFQLPGYCPIPLRYPSSSTFDSSACSLHKSKRCRNNDLQPQIRQTHSMSLSVGFGTKITGKACRSLTVGEYNCNSVSQEFHLQRNDSSCMNGYEAFNRKPFPSIPKSFSSSAVQSAKSSVSHGRESLKGAFLTPIKPIKKTQFSQTSVYSSDIQSLRKPSRASLGCAAFRRESLLPRNSVDSTCLPIIENSCLPISGEENHSKSDCDRKSSLAPEVVIPSNPIFPTTEVNYSSGPKPNKLVMRISRNIDSNEITLSSISLEKPDFLKSGSRSQSVFLEITVSFGHQGGNISPTTETRTIRSQPGAGIYHFQQTLIFSNLELETTKIICNAYSCENCSTLRFLKPKYKCLGYACFTIVELDPCESLFFKMMEQPKKCGQMLVSLWYQYPKNRLVVTVIRCRGLNRYKFWRPNPIVAVTLARKDNSYSETKLTRQKWGKTNPNINEPFTFDLPDRMHSQNRIKLAVYDKKRFGSNKLMGEVCLSVDGLQTGQTSSHYKETFLNPGWQKAKWYDLIKT